MTGSFSRRMKAIERHLRGGQSAAVLSRLTEISDEALDLLIGIYEEDGELSPAAAARLTEPQAAVLCDALCILDPDLADFRRVAKGLAHPFFCQWIVEAKEQQRGLWRG